MSFLKRIFTYLFIFLLFVSLYKDLKSEIVFEHKNNKLQNDNINPNIIVSTYNYKGVSITVERGDTLLSIIEQLNGNKIHALEIDNILHDFMELNPNKNPYNLTSNTTYLFPLYDE